MDKNLILKKLLGIESDLYRAPEFDSKNHLLHEIRAVVKMLKLEEAKSLADRLEKMNKKLYDKAYGTKPTAKLVDPKKTKINGFSTYFKK